MLDDYNMKTVNLAEEEGAKYAQKFKERLKVFDDVSSLRDAAEIAKKDFGIHLGVNYINVGNAYCTITNMKDYLRIVYNTKDELICYNFTKDDR